MTDITTRKVNDRELELTALIDAPREKVFRAWTDPDLIVQWFTPAPWSTKSAEIDARAGGSSLIVMADPDGKEYPNPGVYLEVVPNEKLVFTDAFTEAWQPNEKPFFVGILTFEDEGGKTRYTARARHWTKEACDEHEKMGFHEGWTAATEQLKALLAKI